MKIEFVTDFGQDWLPFPAPWFCTITADSLRRPNIQKNLLFKYIIFYFLFVFVFCFFFFIFSSFLYQHGGPHSSVLPYWLHCMCPSLVKGALSFVSSCWDLSSFHGSALVSGTRLDIYFPYRIQGNALNGNLSLKWWSIPTLALYLMMPMTRQKVLSPLHALECKYFQLQFTCKEDNSSYIRCFWTFPSQYSGLETSW